MVDKNLFLGLDGWLRDNNVITPQMHNSIVLNLYMNNPKCRYVEYYFDQEAKEIEVYLHYNIFNFLILSKKNLQESVKDLIRQYLPEYEVAAYKVKYVKK